MNPNYDDEGAVCICCGAWIDKEINLAAYNYSVEQWKK